MCLAVPMRIKSVDGYAAVCEAKGIERSFAQLKDLAGLTGSQGSIAILTQPSARAAKTS